MKDPLILGLKEYAPRHFQFDVLYCRVSQFCQLVLLMSFHGVACLELPIMVYVVHIKLLSKNFSSFAIKHGLFITCNHVINMITCKMHDINLIIE